MKASEAIRAIQRYVDNLPEGVDPDPDIKIAMCDGSDIELTGEVEFDVATEIGKGNEIRGVFIMAKGHPHLDGGKRLRGAADEIEDRLKGD